MQRPVINLADLEVRTASEDRAPHGDGADKYDIRWAEIGSRVGARKLGYNLTVVAPGKRNCPFHSHHAEEEMFLILEGNGEIRIGDETFPIRTGDVVACPPGGPETAHQLHNTGDAELKVLAVSTTESPEICDYPDSGKFGVLAFFGAGPDGRPQMFAHVGRATDSRDYWEDE